MTPKPKLPAGMAKPAAMPPAAMPKKMPASAAMASKAAAKPAFGGKKANPFGKK